MFRAILIGAYFARLCRHSEDPSGSEDVQSSNLVSAEYFIVRKHSRDRPDAIVTSDSLRLHLDVRRGIHLPCWGYLEITYKYTRDLRNRRTNFFHFNAESISPIFRNLLATMSFTQPKVDIFSGFFNTVNGNLSGTEKTRHGINPATSGANPPVPLCTLRDVDLAVTAGKRAFGEWSKEPLNKRQKAVLDAANILEDNKTDLAKLLTLEQGKPVRGTVKYSLR